MLSKEQANDYVSNTLKLKNVDKRLTEDPLELLDDIIYKFYHTVNFQNLTLLATPLGDRKVPTVQQNIDAILKGEGGLCWTLGSFMFCLLQGLGYKARPLASTGVNPNDHFLVLVEDLVKSGDQYLVEVGLGEPSFCSIDLDFEKKTKIYQNSYSHFKYCREDDKIWRLFKGREGKSDENPDGWKKCYFFTLDPVELELFLESMKTIYENKEGYFEKKFRLIEYHDGKCVAMKENEILIENDKNTLVSTPLEDIAAMKEAIIKHFKHIPSGLGLALEAYRKVNNLK